MRTSRQTQRVIERGEAERLARTALAEHTVPCVLMDEHTLEEPLGWVFFYQSASHVETRNFSDQLAGNAPLVVFRDTGEVRTRSSGMPSFSYVRIISSGS